MSKYHELHEDHQELFTDFVDQIDSLKQLEIKILGCNSLKEVCKVSKANDIIQHMTNQDVIILLNENIFEPLDDVQKKMVVEESIAKIYVDEDGRLKIIAPDVHTFSLLLTKYGYPEYERLTVTIKTLYAQAAEEAAQTH